MFKSQRILKMYFSACIVILINPKFNHMLMISLSILKLESNKSTDAYSLIRVLVQCLPGYQTLHS